MRYNPRIVCALFESFGLPSPATEFRFCDGRKWRFDFAWPEEQVALEVEGGVWTRGRHTRGSGFIKDMEKYNTAAFLGWRVLRVTPQEVATTATAEMIRKAMRR